MLPGWLIRFGFHLLYNQLAFSYDLVAGLVSFGQWAAWRRTASLFLQAGPTLELGHGTGGLLADLTAAGLAPVGLDVSPEMGRLARGQLLRGNQPLRLVRARAQFLPFPQASFVNVIATFPTEFILEPETLASVHRVLRSDGRLIIVVMGYLQGPGPLQRLVNWAYRVTGQRHIPEPDPLDTLAQAGFSASWQDAARAGARALLLVATRV
jgi:ubiquinone/menaquinone biosynthesis C-methylase UbiE